jgi:4-hydroxy-3-polyprenylbenzoate decarboxylase
MHNDNGPVAVAFTGASGAAYGLRLLQCLLESGRDVYLLYSQAAQIVFKMECDIELSSRTDEVEAFFTDRFSAKTGQLKVFSRQQWTAPVASGSNPPAAMVICPCTTGTLASVAAGLSQDLIDRAADVMLKEKRPLILVVRETPFSSIHLENMLRLSNAGAVIMPANPGFYDNPQSVSDVIDFMVSRVLDHLGIANTLVPRWGADHEKKHSG